MIKNYLHLYKGKKYYETPTFLGLALRSIGAKKNVSYYSFQKNDNFKTSFEMAKKIPILKTYLINKLSDITSKDSDLIIIDISGYDIEINLEFIDINIQNCEIIISNYTFDPKIEEIADLITETTGVYYE